MKRAISFSLYGKNPKYIEGALSSVLLYQNFYQNWDLHYYVGSSVPILAIEKLVSLGCYVHTMTLPEDASAMLWRWFITFNHNYNYAIIRDCDSLPSLREVNAVDEWIASGKPLHILRDHPFHVAYIMGGMWGCIPRVVSPYLYFINNETYFYNTQAIYGFDQFLLEKNLFIPLRFKSYTHDSCTWLSFRSKSLAPYSSDYSFIGESLERNSSMNTKQRIALKRHQNSLYRKLKLKTGTVTRRLIFELKHLFFSVK